MSARHKAGAGCSQPAPKGLLIGQDTVSFLCKITAEIKGALSSLLGGAAQKHGF